MPTIRVASSRDDAALRLKPKPVEGARLPEGIRRMMVNRLRAEQDAAFLPFPGNDPGLPLAAAR